MARKSGGWSRLVRIGLGLFLVLVVVEGALRMVGDRSGQRPDSRSRELFTSELLRPSRHSEIVFELQPQVRGLLKGRLIQTNSLGLRGAERELVKPDRTFRIVGLGDSHMFGSGVAEGQTYLELLQRRLNDAAVDGRRYEALNFATPGFNTAQEVATLEHRALAFDPDLVLVHYIGDDAGQPRFLATGEPRAGFRLHLFDLIVGPIGDDRQSADAAGGLVGIDAASPELIARFSEGDLMTGAEGVRSSIARLGRLAAGRDLPVIFMMLGDGAAERATVRDTAVEAGFLYLNALPGFREHLVAVGAELTRESWRGAFFLDGDHPSAVAHQVYAELLFERVTGLGY